LRVYRSGSVIADVIHSGFQAIRNNILVFQANTVYENIGIDACIAVLDDIGWLSWGALSC
jgi:hypothetical protein